MNTILDNLSAAFAALARAAVAHMSIAEWALAATLAGAAWLLASGRGWRAVGVLVFVVAVGACAWLSWKAGRYGVLAQQSVLSIMVLHGVLRSRGWTAARRAAK